MANHLPPAAGLDAFADERYLSLETYRQSGEGVRTPVWFVQSGERLYVRTLAGSGKLRRIDARPEVRLAPCDRTGQVHGTWLRGRARRAADFEEDEAAGLLEARYGVLVRQMEAQRAAAGQEYVVLVIELN